MKLKYQDWCALAQQYVKNHEIQKNSKVGIYPVGMWMNLQKKDLKQRTLTKEQIQTLLDYQLLSICFPKEDPIQSILSYIEKDEILRYALIEILCSNTTSIYDSFQDFLVDFLEKIEKKKLITKEQMLEDIDQNIQKYIYHEKKEILPVFSPSMTSIEAKLDLEYYQSKFVQKEMQEVFRLYYLEGYSKVEICQELKLSLSKVDYYDTLIQTFLWEQYTKIPASLKEKIRSSNANTYSKLLNLCMTLTNEEVLLLKTVVNIEESNLMKAKKFHRLGFNNTSFYTNVDFYKECLKKIL